MMIKYIMKCSIGHEITVRFYSDFEQLKAGLFRWNILPGAKCECYNVQECCLADLSEFVAYLYDKLCYEYECVDEIEIIDMEGYLDGK